MGRRIAVTAMLLAWPPPPSAGRGARRPDHRGGFEDHLDSDRGDGDQAGGVPGDDGSEGNGLAVGLGIAGLVAGLAGAALGGLAYARTRRTAG